MTCYGHDHGEDELIEREEWAARRRDPVEVPAFLLAAFIFLFAGYCLRTGAPVAMNHEAVVWAVLNEAANQSDVTMTACAYTFKNREARGMGLGSARLFTPGVMSRVWREKRATWGRARHAVAEAYAGRSYNPVGDALYMENVDHFGVPAYVANDKKIEWVAEVGALTFWRKRK